MEELMKLPELKGNPLAKRVYTVMGKYVNNTPERLDVFQYTTNQACVLAITYFGNYVGVDEMPIAIGFSFSLSC